MLKLMYDDTVIIPSTESNSLHTTSTATEWEVQKDLFCIDKNVSYVQTQLMNEVDFKTTTCKVKFIYDDNSVWRVLTRAILLTTHRVIILLKISL